MSNINPFNILAEVDAVPVNTQKIINKKKYSEVINNTHKYSEYIDKNKNYKYNKTKQNYSPNAKYDQIIRRNDSATDSRNDSRNDLKTDIRNDSRNNLRNEDIIDLTVPLDIVSEQKSKNSHRTAESPNLSIRISDFPHQQNNTSKKNEHIMKNIKRILCYNMLKSGSCNYGSKCLYAHNLDEQNIDNIKKRAYELLTKDDLSDINLLEDNELFETLVQMTKLCIMCTKKQNLCPGGYNCKNGTFSPKYQICYSDLVKGECNNNFCKNIHLTKSKLVSYNNQHNSVNMAYDNDNSNEKETEDNLLNLNSTNHDQYADKIKTYVSILKKSPDLKDSKNKTSKQTMPKPTNNTISGTLLTDEFFQHFNKKNNKYINDSDTDSDMSIDEFYSALDYLNYNSDQECDESIFIYDNYAHFKI